MRAYYNEIEHYAAQWTRNLVDAIEVAPGVVDERTIVDVFGSDIGSGQAHFFAGAGGWSEALRLAGIDDDAPVWTGSCPCQPYSRAGLRKKNADARHLWPIWRGLVDAKRPGVIFGEQVVDEGARGEWWPVVLHDLNAMGYIARSVDSAAGGSGAPHPRARLWWAAVHQDVVGHAHSYRTRRDGRAGNGAQTPLFFDSWGLGDVSRTSGLDGLPLGDADSDVLARPGLLQLGGSRGAGSGSRVVWLECERGRVRPTQPGLCPLADGIPGRSSRVRAYGNAIVPQVAAEFVSDVFDWLEGVA